MRRFTQVVILLAGVALAPATAMASETINYSYDARGRLVKVQHSGNVNNGVVTDYGYDKADNRTLKTTSGGPAQCLIPLPFANAAPIPVLNCPGE